MIAELHESMPIEVYHNSYAISKSGLDRINRSPAHYCAWLKEKKKPSPEMKFGTRAHTFILEPEKVQNLYEIEPELNKNTNKYKALRADVEASGKEFISADDWRVFSAMRKAVHEHPEVKKLFKFGKAEQSIFWNDERTGMACRCRPDWLDKGLIVDLKTTEDARPETFMRHAYNMRYHVQAAFYIDGVKAHQEVIPHFFFIVVERKPPHGVVVYQASHKFIELGRQEYRRNLATYSECIHKNEWPAYCAERQLLEVPAWAN